MKQAAVSPLYLVCGVLVLEFHSVLEYSLVVQSETICFSPERNEIEFFFFAAVALLRHIYQK